MMTRKIHVVIQMEAGNPGPIDAFILCQMGQEFILRRGGGKDYVDFPFSLNESRFMASGHIPGSSLSHFIPGRKNIQL